MVQPELPFAYEKVRSVDKKNYQLPLRWKAVFVLLIIYSIALSTVTYVRATQSPAQAAPQVAGAFEAQTEPAPTAALGSGQVKMKAKVLGWYDVLEMDSTNIIVKTNMKVWVNGRAFVRCDDCGQEKLDSSLLDY
jgi:hypothetical protein